MPIVLQRATRDDLVVINAVASRAFGPGDIIDTQLFSAEARAAPDWDDDIVVQWHLQRTAAEIEKPWMHFVKAVDLDDGGKVVGMAQWERPDATNLDRGLTAEERRAAMREAAKAWPASLNSELYIDMKSRIADVVHEQLGDERVADMWSRSFVLHHRERKCEISDGCEQSYT